jgi:hypothetical protein
VTTTERLIHHQEMKDKMPGLLPGRVIMGETSLPSQRLRPAPPHDGSAGAADSGMGGSGMRSAGGGAAASVDADDDRHSVAAPTLAAPHAPAAGIAGSRKKGVSLAENVEAPANQNDAVRHLSLKTASRTLMLASQNDDVRHLSLKTASRTLMLAAASTKAVLSKEAVIEIFERFDINGDDGINLSEFRLALKSLGFAGGQQAVRDLMQQFDSDHSGEMNLEQFTKVCNTLYRSEGQVDRSRIAEIDKSFHGSVDHKIDFTRNQVENKPGWVRDPSAIWSMLWDAVQLVLLIYVALSVTLKIGFDLPPTGIGSITWFVELLIDIYFLIDVVLAFFTVYEDPTTGFFISDRRRIVRTYLFSTTGRGLGWFWIDFVSAFPLECASCCSQFHVLRCVELWLIDTA